MSARWTDGEDDARIDLVLRRRYVRAAFQPVVRFETGLTAAYQASVRGPLGSPLEHEDRLFVAAAHRGAAKELDELRLATVLDAADRAKLAAPLAVMTKRNPNGLGACATVGRVPLVAELDAGGSSRQLRVVADAASRVRDEGWRVALRNLGTDGRSTSALGAIAPDFVKVDTKQVARDGRLLEVLAEYASTTGCVLIAEGVDSDQEVAVLREAGIAFGHGMRFGRPDLLVRAPVLHDAAGLTLTPANATATSTATAA